MASDEKTSLPSYEESVTGNQFQDQRLDGQRIVDSFNIVRAQHIHATVNTHIYPLIKRRAECGLSKTVLTLIPLNLIGVDESAIALRFSQGT